MTTLYLHLFLWVVRKTAFSFFVLTSFSSCLTFLSTSQQRACHGVPLLIDALHFYHSLRLFYVCCLLPIYLEIFFILFPPDLHDSIHATAKRRNIVKHPWITSIQYFQGVHCLKPQEATLCLDHSLCVSSVFLLTYRKHHFTTLLVFITDVIYCVVLCSPLPYIIFFYHNFQLLFWVIV